MEQNCDTYRQSHLFKRFSKLALLILCLLSVLLASATTGAQRAAAQQTSLNDQAPPVDTTETPDHRDSNLYVSSATHIYKVRAKDGAIIWTSPELDRISG